MPLLWAEGGRRWTLTRGKKSHIAFTTQLQPPRPLRGREDAVGHRTAVSREKAFSLSVQFVALSRDEVLQQPLNHAIRPRVPDPLTYRSGGKRRGLTCAMPPLR